MALGFGASLRRCPDPESSQIKYPMRSQYKYEKVPYQSRFFPRILRRDESRSLSLALTG
jgi:hypothetical protein